MSGAVRRLQCAVQNYAWGKVGRESAVLQFHMAAQPEAKFDESLPYAELWVGTHPNAPSQVVGENGALLSLSEFLSAHAETYLGPAHRKHFGDDLPFILKLLSVQKALSIQAHPDKHRAAVLHAQDPSNYPDDNHKPELAVAITPFVALCCFRSAQEIAEFLNDLQPFRDLVGNQVAEAFEKAAASGNGVAEALRELLRVVMESKADDVFAACERISLAACEDLLERTPTSPLDKALYIFRSISQDFPNDVGLFLVFLLNIVELNPGDGLFLQANEPHAYLRGDCVEIMAKSDNVVRAGLTPKFKDVKVLCDMLSYNTEALKSIMFTESGPHTRYAPKVADVDEFHLTRYAVKDEPTEHKAQSVACVMVLEGEVAVQLNGADAGTAGKGSVLLVPIASTVRMEATGGATALVFVAETAYQREA